MNVRIASSLVFVALVAGPAHAAPTAPPADRTTRAASRFSARARAAVQAALGAQRSDVRVTASRTSDRSSRLVARGSKEREGSFGSSGQARTTVVIDGKHFASDRTIAAYAKGRQTYAWRERLGETRYPFGFSVRSRVDFIDQSPDGRGTGLSVAANGKALYLGPVRLIPLGQAVSDEVLTQRLWRIGHSAVKR